MSYQYGATKQVEFTVADLEREEAALLQALARVRRNLEAKRARMEAHRERLALAPAVKPVEVLPCGTYAAYMRHYRQGEIACAACKDAYNAYQFKFRARSPRKLTPCGTLGAYRRHLRHDEQPCEACKLASAIYQRNRRAQAATGAPATPPSTADLAA